MTPATPTLRANYGFDAPILIPIPIILAVLNIALAIRSHSIGPLIGAVAWIGVLGCGLYNTRRGKFVVWAQLIDELNLRGDERILDVGCGRGAVLLNAARHLTTGRAVGVDRWRKLDQSGNAAGATRSNAVAEGVSERVDLITADAECLPFADGNFDLVLSSLALHNIKGRLGRERAITEIIRVLKPGGRVLIADLWATRDYARALSELHVSNVTRRNLGWRMWWGGPWVPTRLLTATKV